MTQSELQLTMLLLVAIDQGQKLAGMVVQLEDLNNRLFRLCDQWESRCRTTHAERDELRAELARATGRGVK